MSSRHGHARPINRRWARLLPLPRRGFSRVGFLGRRSLVPVGAGVVMGWVGTLVVARVSVEGRTKGDRKGCRLPRRPSPPPHPNPSHPYEHAAASPASLPQTPPVKL